MWFLKGIQADFRFFSCLTLVQSMHYIFDICVYLSGYFLQVFYSQREGGSRCEYVLGANMFPHIFSTTKASLTRLKPQSRPQQLKKPFRQGYEAGDNILITGFNFHNKCNLSVHCTMYSSCTTNYIEHFLINLKFWRCVG